MKPKGMQLDSAWPLWAREALARRWQEAGPHARGKAYADKLRAQVRALAVEDGAAPLPDKRVPGAHQASE